MSWPLRPIFHASATRIEYASIGSGLASKRSGREKLAPKTLGNRKYKVLGKAPGTYVMERA